MSDRIPVRDRTLVLRILVPGLEARLRDKMKECEERCAETSHNKHNNHNDSSNNNPSPVDSYLDLDGVTCEPTPARNKTLWSFNCDGARYPAMLVNLPCPVELHKTHDHAMYYKSVDLGQMLIVYEDEMALEEAQEKPMEGYPSYFHSGLTPPMRNVVEKRFAAREHQHVPPPRMGVAAVEEELVRLMEQINKDEKTKKIKPTKTGAVNPHSHARVLEEVTEEIVNYEPWMDEYGRAPQGIEFDADDQICSAHPEVWVRPEDIAAIYEEAAAKKRQQEEQKKKRLEAEAAIPAAKPKKGIASKKNRAAEAASAPPAPMVDDLTLAATSMMAGDGGDLLGEVDDDFFKDLDLEHEEMNFEGIDDM